MISKRSSVIKLERNLTPKDVASSLAYPELEEILIAQGICPSVFADSCHMLGYQTYQTVSNDSYHQNRQAGCLCTRGSTMRQYNVWVKANDPSDLPPHYARQRLR